MNARSPLRVVTAPGMGLLWQPLAVLAAFIALSLGFWLAIHPAHESEAAESFKPAASDVLTLRVDSSGQCYLKDRALHADEMKIMLQEFRTSRPDASVVLETPDDLKAAQLVEIMRVLKSAGIRHSAVQPVRP